MKALNLLAAASLAACALFAASSDAEAQRAPPAGGGSFRGAPPPGGGGSFRGAPHHGGGYYRGSPSSRGYYPVHGYPRGGTSFYFGVYGPGYWWGPGYWPGYWPGYGWGSGYWGPRYVYPPDYAYYPPVYAPPVAPVYIERDAPNGAADAWWYWCTEAKAYYPYVKECPGGWQRVPPQAVPPAKQ